MATQAFTRPPKKPITPYIRLRVEKRKPLKMTIGLGFNTVDGIVLCADTQLTSRNVGMKFNDSKIHTISSLGGPHTWTVGIVYAGDQAIFKSFYEILSNSLRGNWPTIDEIRDEIQKALFTVHQNCIDPNAEFIDIVCALSVDDDKPQMVVGRRTTLHIEDSFAFIGVGDSSLSRFLADVMPIETQFNTKSALLLGTYLIDQAKTFTDGCGGETQTLIVAEGVSSIYKPQEKAALDRQSREISALMHQCVRNLFQVLIDPENEMQSKVDLIRNQLHSFYALPI